MTIYAFPSGHNPKTGRQEEGMTLRDYFAAKAMQGMYSNELAVSTYEDNAKWAYQMADAMMKVRDE